MAGVSSIIASNNPNVLTGGMSVNSGAYPLPIAADKPASSNPAANVVSPAQLAAVGAKNQAQYNQIIATSKANNALANQSLTSLSSNKSPDIANIKSTTDGLAKAGVTTDPNTGITQNADGSAHNPVPTLTTTVKNADGSITNTYSDGTTKTVATDASGNTTTGGYFNGTYYAPGSTVPKDASGNPATLTPTDPVDDAILKQLNDQIASNDATTAAMVANITQQYNNLILQQQQSNTSSEAATNAFLLKGGSLQHTQSGQGALQSQVKYGLQQIADLNTKEQAAILQAQQAGQSQDFKLQDQINQDIMATRTAKQAAATTLSDHIFTANQQLAQQQFETQKDTTDSINSIASDAAKNGASPSVLKAIGGAKTVADAINAAGDSLQIATGQLGDYLQYKRDAQANGQVPTDYNTWKQKDDAYQANLKAKEAYGTAFNSALGKAAGENKSSGGNGVTIPVTVSTGALNGLTLNAPVDIAAYVHVSNNGVRFVDLSGVSKTDLAGLAKIAVQNGYKVITDASQATDVLNITDALGKIDDIRNAFALANAGTPEQRNSYAAAFNTVIKGLEASPDFSPADVYQAAALDVVKAMSGTKGGRISQETIKSVEASMPKSTDTLDYGNKKLDTMAKLIEDRQTALVGKPGASDQELIDNGKAKTAIDTYTSHNPKMLQKITAAYSVPGITDADVLEYIKNPANGFDNYGDLP